MLLDKTIIIPDLGPVGPESGFHLLETTEDGKFVSGKNGVDCIVATGGSAVYGENAMKNLKKNGVVVYLKVNADELEKRICNIHKRGIAMKEGTTIRDLYSERAPLYEKYADIRIDCSESTVDENVAKIKAQILDLWGMA